MVSDPSGRGVEERPPAIFPARKPVLRAKRISLFEREERIHLSPAALELLFQGASLMSEGDFCGDWYGGSTMITFDLARASHRLSEACDQVTAQQLETLLLQDTHVHERVRALAFREAERRAGRRLHESSIDIRVHRDGRYVHLDLDIEARARGPR